MQWRGCRTLVVSLILFAARVAFGQNPEDAFHWDVQCEQRGCMMSLDVLHGALGEKKAPDPKDSRQYLSLMVAVDRMTRKPAYLAFHFPPDADQKQGFFIKFVKDELVNGQWSLKPDVDLLKDALGFDSCDADSCVARLREGKVDDGHGGLIDLFKQFNSADHLWLLYARKGQPIRTMIPLGPFKTAYKQVIEKELAPQQ